MLALSAQRAEALAREIDVSTKIPNAMEGRARVALARGDIETAVVAVQRLLDHVGTGDHVPSAAALDGTENICSPDAARGVAPRGGSARRRRTDRGASRSHARSRRDHRCGFTAQLSDTKSGNREIATLSGQITADQPSIRSRAGA